MSIAVSDISDAIFNHIEKRHIYPIEKVKLCLSKYNNDMQEKQRIIDNKKFEYAEKYETNRNIQDQLYDTYLQERKELYDQWKKDKSKATLHKMLNMSFEYKEIPEIYTYSVISDKPVPKPKEKVEPKPNITTKTSKDCPPGKVLNPKTGRCITDKTAKTTKTTKTTKTSDTEPNPAQPDQPDQPAKTTKDCPPGKVLNPKTGRCITDKTANVTTTKPEAAKATKDCPPGKVLNPKTGRCITDKTSNTAKTTKATYCGITNLGNSCYINASLQALANIPEFNKVIQDIPSEKRNPLINAYSAFYDAYKNNKVPSKVINDLVKALNKNLPKSEHFSVKNQEDMYQFMLKFFEVLNNTEVNDLFQIKIETNFSFPKTIKKEKKVLRCDEVKQPNEIKETEVIVQFDNTDKLHDIGSILTSRYNGIKEEVSKEDDYLQCTNVYNVTDNVPVKTPEKFPYIRTDKITNYPSIIKLNLNIFNANLKKSFVPLKIPNSWQHNGHKYKLAGMGLHIGKSKNSGHYVYFSHTENKWVEYSDDSAEEYKDIPTVDKTHYYKLSDDVNGYNLFYTDAEVPCPYLLYYQKIE